MTGDEEDYFMPKAFDTDEGEHGAALRSLKKKLRSGAGKGPSRGKAGRGPVTSVAKVEADRGRKNSRTKGSRAELDVAEMFSRWGGEVVRRTPLSGGWSSAKFGVTADLVCANPAFPFHVEVKHREGWVLDDLVTGVRNQHDKSVHQWWAQCLKSCPKRTSAADHGPIIFLKTPLLVFRRNHLPWMVMMQAEACEHDDVAASFTLPVTSAGRPSSVVSSRVSVMLLGTFLELEPVPAGLANHGSNP